MDERYRSTKRGLTALIAAALLWTIAGPSMADHHEGVADAAKEMAQDMTKEAVDTTTPSATEEGDPGQQAFTQFCASCHGTDAKGTGPLADTLKTKPADLTQISKKNGGEFNSGDVARMIDGQQDIASHGPREMPVWGVEFAEKAGDIAEGSAGGKRYARASIVQLVRYIESIQE